MSGEPIETCPEDGTEFLAYDPVAKAFDVCKCEVVTGKKYGGGTYCYRDIRPTQSDGEYGPMDDDFQGDRATLWWPLPDPEPVFEVSWELKRRVRAMVAAQAWARKPKGDQDS